MSPTNPHHNSSDLTDHHISTPYNGPHLRSQYPRDSLENHVEYILVASFDIDRGSIMEHQYPGPISGDEHMLAELMLPDQTHMRSQDWTIFFLHKDTTAEEEAKEERRERRERRRRRRRRLEAGESPTFDEDGEEDDYEEGDDDSDLLSESTEDEAEGPPLIYVLNLVNTKQDQTVKRGAIVKAMAICTRHSFLHIYKPLLLLALEEYFRSPQLDTLEMLYNALNSMDLSLMPRLTHLERNILQSSDAKDMFVEKFSIMIQQRMSEDSADRLVQNGGSNESLTYDQSPTKLTRGAQYGLPRDTHEFDSRVLYNGVPVPVKVPVAITPEQVGDFSLIKLITTFSTPHRDSPQPFTTHPHLTTSGPLTHPIIVLINALLTQKRIIFLGHNQPSGSVAEAVLAACALASGGILKGFTRHAFPYTDLTKIDDLLKVPGFIAGVTNPAFANKPEWWDVLCDLPTGRMKISPKIEAAPLTEGFSYFEQHKTALGLQNGHHESKSKSHKGDDTADAANDNLFMDAVHNTIQNRLGEGAVRNRFRTFIHRFTLLAAAFEETVYGASALRIGASETDADAYGYGVRGHGLVWPDEATRHREIQANVGRVEGWRQSRSYFSLIRDLAAQWERGECVRGIDLGYQTDRLRFQKIGEAASGDIYKAMAQALEMAGVDPSDPDYDSDSDLPAEDLLSPEAYLGGYPRRRPSRYGQDSPGILSERLYRRHKARYDAVNQLLCVMPESSGGLFHLSLGLFHKEREVRFAVARALEIVMGHEAGRHSWGALGRFAKVGFLRVRKEMDVGSGGAGGMGRD